jgi:hypothetical protein
LESLLFVLLIFDVKGLRKTKEFNTHEQTQILLLIELLVLTIARGDQALSLEVTRVDTFRSALLAILFPVQQTLNIHVLLLFLPRLSVIILQVFQI